MGHCFCSGSAMSGCAGVEASTSVLLTEIVSRLREWTTLSILLWLMLLDELNVKLGSFLIFACVQTNVTKKLNGGNDTRLTDL